MELLLQMGYGMQALSIEMITKWGGGTAILSPVNTKPDKVVSLSKKIQKVGGSVLFDPQMFYPKNAHNKLKEYDYWIDDSATLSDNDSLRGVGQELLRINTDINSDKVILPCIAMREDTFGYGIKIINSLLDYFRSKTDKKLLATVCLYPETIRNETAIETIIETLRRLEVDGYYIIPRPSNGEYIVSDPLWEIGLLRLLICLKLSHKYIIVGYSNHQGLLYSLAKIDGLATGTWMNTRSFMPNKFQSPRDEDVKNRSVWYYLPTSMCEYKAALLDVAQRRGYLPHFEPKGVYVNEYSEMLFSGAQPSSTNYTEANSFKHYLHCIRQQCALLTRATYKETFTTYEFILEVANQNISDFKKRGISGQNRDFAPAIEANKVSMYANNEDYGLQLELGWSDI